MALSSADAVADYLVIRSLTTTVDLLLYTPRTAAGKEHSTLRVMHLSASDIELLGETVVDVKRETILSVSMADVFFEDISDSAAVAKIGRAHV